MAAETRPQIDFETARQTDPAFALELLGHAFGEKGNALVGICPLPSHTGKKTPGKFYFYLDTRRFKCFQCNRHGDLIDLVRLVKPASDNYEAAQWLLNLAEAEAAAGTAEGGDTPTPAEDPAQLSDYERGIAEACVALAAPGLTFLFRKAQHPEGAAGYVCELVQTLCEQYVRKTV
jgi:hypothetical protein